MGHADESNGLHAWPQETLADKARISLTALKRLESENRLDVYETTRDQVRRALEAAGIVLLSTDRGQGVLLVHGQDEKRHRQIHDV